MTMIRLLIFLLWIVFFAVMLTLLISSRSAIAAEAFGWRMEIPAGLAALGALAFAGIVALGTSVLKDFAAAPKAARARREIEKREKGLAALTKGLEAIAAGDGAAARREAQAAARSLGAAPVTKLIAAQAAQLAGDDVTTGEALADMLDAPETEFLALRGLYARAMRAGDHETARGYAERAFDRRDKARWAFEAVFDLALDRNDFAAAQAALDRATKSKAIAQDKSARAAAAISTAAAYASYAAGEHEAARVDAEAAVKRAPGFAPAAVLAARLQAAKGDARRAEKLLGAAFEKSPARALVDALDWVCADGAREDKAAALDRLAAKNSDARDALFASARARLLLSDASTAASIAVQILRSSATARAFALMAEAQSALAGDIAAHQWMARAATAPADDAPTAESFFRITGDGWRRLIRAYMEDGALFPTPLAAPAPGLAEEEIPSANAPLIEITPPPPEEIALEEVAATGQETAKDDQTGPEEALDRDADAARTVS